MYIFSERYPYCNINSVIRVVASVHLSYATYYDFKHVLLPVTLGFGGKFKYLTVWNEVCSKIYIF